MRNARKYPGGGEFSAVADYELRMFSQPYRRAMILRGRKICPVVPAFGGQTMAINQLASTGITYSTPCATPSGV